MNEVKCPRLDSVSEVFVNVTPLIIYIIKQKHKLHVPV